MFIITVREMCFAPIEWQWDIFNDFPHGPSRISPTEILPHYCPMSFGLYGTQSSSTSGNIFSRNEWQKKHFLGILGTQPTQFGMLPIVHSIWTSKFKLLPRTHVFLLQQLSHLQVREWSLVFPACELFFRRLWTLSCGSNPKGTSTSNAENPINKTGMINVTESIIIKLSSQVDNKI